jgi:hypothetical protein
VGGNRSTLEKTDGDAMLDNVMLQIETYIYAGSVYIIPRV